jgi:hypothetical protein
MPALDEQVAREVSERGDFIVPTPRISYGRPAFDAGGVLSVPLTSGGERGRWHAAWRGDGEPWLAVHAGVGPARLLVSWAAPRSGLGSECSPPPGYRIESAASSTNGTDGDFRFELRVTDNTARARAHVIEFDGQSWLRITFERADVGRSDVGRSDIGRSDTGHSVGSEDAVDIQQPVGIERLDLHDASDGTDDVWLILGDDLARAGLMADPGEPGFAELIHERYPGYYPALIDETRSGERPAATLARIVELLETHSHVRHVAIAYAAAPTGHEDAGANIDGNTHGDADSNADAEAAALAALVSKLVAHDRRVTIARPPRPDERRGIDPHSGASSLDRTSVEVERRGDLVPGPDLRSWFAAHPDQLDADGRPTAEGRRAMRRLWVDALDVLYVPQ